MGRPSVEDCLSPSRSLGLDANGMGPFLALGGAILAINRFDRHSPEELGMEQSARLVARLDFRSSIQLFLTLIAAVAPYRALTMLALKIGEVGWERQAAATVGTCLILWLVLLLAVPTGTFFGLQSVQRNWRLADIVFQAGSLEQRWGNRWGKAISQPAATNFLPLRIAANWSLISILITGSLVCLVLVMNPGYEVWMDREYVSFALTFGIYLYVGGLVVLISSLGFAVMALNANGQGREGSSRLLRWLALCVPAFFATLTLMTIGVPYLPTTVPVFLTLGIQVLCVNGLLNPRPLTPQRWNPMHQLIQDLRDLNHTLAHERWAALRRSWASRLAELSRSESKKALREAKAWRDRHGLELPFVSK